MNGQLQTCPTCGKQFSSLLGENCPSCLMLLGTPELGKQQPVPGEAPRQKEAGSRAKESEVKSHRMLRDYELLEPLAQGGRGTVYRAWQTSLKRTVAVKALMGAEFANLAARQKFRRESELAASLNHPNIVAIYE